LQLKLSLLNRYKLSSKSGANTMTEVTKFEQNEFQDDELVCYCFEYTRNDIEKDYLKNSRSMILEKIASEKKAGGCDCAKKNPKGR
jgi:hypothetical protein